MNKGSEVIILQKRPVANVAKKVTPVNEIHSNGDIFSEVGLGVKQVIDSISMSEQT